MTDRKKGLLKQGILCLVLILPLMITACGKKGDPVPPEEPVVTK